MHHDIFFTQSLGFSAPALPTITMFCFVVTHSFLHCHCGPSLKCQLRRPPSVALKNEWVLQDEGLCKSFLGVCSLSLIKLLIHLKNCLMFTFYTWTVLTRHIFRLWSRFYMSPLHKLQQTVVNNSPFIIKWVCWIQLLYICTYKKTPKHMGSVKPLL